MIKDIEWWGQLKLDYKLLDYDIQIKIDYWLYVIYKYVHNILCAIFHKIETFYFSIPLSIISTHHYTEDNPGKSK